MEIIQKSYKEEILVQMPKGKALLPLHYNIMEAEKVFENLFRNTTLAEFKMSASLLKIAQKYQATLEEMIKINNGGYAIIKLKFPSKRNLDVFDEEIRAGLLTKSSGV